MTDYTACTPVGLDYASSADNVFIAQEIVCATPQQIFEVFEDAHAWTVWAMPITRVVWTSPRPYGIGTTRSVHMLGGLVGYEEFIAWEEGRRMAFTFVGTNKPAVEKFLEDYLVEDIGNGTCRVTWTMAMQPSGFSRHLMFLTRPFMRWYNRRMFRKFREYTEGYARRSASISAVS